MIGSAAQLNEPQRTSWRRDFYVMATASGLIFAGLTGSFHPTLSLYALDLKASAFALGLLFTLPRLLGIFLRFPSGALASAIGQKKVLTWGAFLCVVAPLLLLAASSMSLLVVIASFFGLSNLFGPAAMAYVHDRVPEEERIRMLGQYAVASAMGTSLGPFLAGLLLDAAHSYHLVFLFCSLLSLLALGLLRTLSGGEARQVEGSVRQHVKADLAAVVRMPALQFSCIGRSLQGFMAGTLYAFFPWYGRTIVGLSASEIGTVLGAITFTSVIARALTGRIAGRARLRQWIMVVTTVGSAFLMAGLFHANSFLMLLFLSTWFGMHEGICHITTVAHLSESSGSRYFGSAIGMVWTMGDFGIAMGRFLPGLALPAALTTIVYGQTFLYFGFGIAVAAAASPSILLLHRKARS